MGLYAGPDKQAAAAWFHDCEFSGSLAGVPGEVAIENRNCRVYSTTFLPTIWDRELGSLVSAWRLILDEVPASGETTRQPRKHNLNAFADVESDPESTFLRPRDEFFRRIVREESISTLLTELDIDYLPEGTAYRTRDPSGYPKSRPNFGLIAGLGASCVLCVLPSLLAGWCLCFRKRYKNDLGDKMPPPAPIASSVASNHLPATNSHWVTEFSTTFTGTMCTPDVPPPEPGAPAAKKLEFLHTQLNGIAKDAVILERFNLLGPNQRRQGGAYHVLIVPAQRGCERERWQPLPLPGPTQGRPGCRNRGTTEVGAD